MAADSPGRERVREQMQNRLYRGYGDTEDFEPDVKFFMRENPKLERWLTPQHNLTQAIVILDAINAGVAVEKLSSPDLNFQQMRAILGGLKKGNDITKYVNESYDSMLMNQVAFAMRDGMSSGDIKMIADPRYNGKQAQEVRLGLLNGVDVSRYADPRNDADRMRQMRYAMEQVGLDPEVMKMADDIQKEMEENPDAWTGASLMPLLA
ncbi:MAG: hypothetical protein FWD58_02540 [Firmicutes bacterium]|nr:hypothetical protein [Bacillota bacterium]